MTQEHNTLAREASATASLEDLNNLDGTAIAVARGEYRAMTPADLKSMLTPGAGIFDIKCILDRAQCAELQLPVWRL